MTYRDSDEEEFDAQVRSICADAEIQISACNARIRKLIRSRDAEIARINAAVGRMTK